MLIDKCHIRSIIYDYRQESPYLIQHLDLDVLMERIWKYIERRESRIMFEIEALNLNLLVANPLTQRGWELAIEQVIEFLKADTYKAGDREECSICHGKGSTTDPHDPCSNCGGKGYID